MEPWRKDLYANELYHFGIKGMKWGVRRYQNKDGTLTLAGKKRKLSVEQLRNEKRQVYQKRFGELDKQYGLTKSVASAHEYDEKHHVYDPSYDDGNKRRLSIERKSVENWNRAEVVRQKVHKEAEDFAEKYILEEYGQQAIDKIKNYKTLNKRSTAFIAAMMTLPLAVLGGIVFGRQD